MNDHEKDIENRLSNIDDIEKSVAELNNIDLSSISVDDLKEKINDCFPIIFFDEVLWDSNYHIFRVRKNFNNSFNKPYKNLNNIGLPPADRTPFGRSNNEFEPIFYGSREGDLALFESCQNLTQADRFTPQNFTMGIWKIKTNETLRLVPIIDNTTVQQTRKDIKKVSEISQNLINQSLSSQKVMKATEIISKFFADQFAKTEIKNHHDYKISSFFSNCIKATNKISIVKFDGILYPSVAYKYKGDNVALFPESLHKIEPVKCFSVAAYNFDFEKGILTKGIISEGKILNNGEIIWKE